MQYFRIGDVNPIVEEYDGIIQTAKTLEDAKRFSAEMKDKILSLGIWTDQKTGTRISEAPGTPAAAKPAAEMSEQELADASSKRNQESKLRTENEQLAEELHQRTLLLQDLKKVIEREIYDENTEGIDGAEGKELIGRIDSFLK